MRAGGPTRATLPIAPGGRAVTRYQITLEVDDRPGVLATIAGILADGRVSIATVEQSIIAEELDGEPAILVATAGDVNAGGFDPLAAMADLAAEHGAWLHVDAAFGLLAACSPRTQELACGIDRAHSVAVDGKEIGMPLKEFELLELLLRNAGRVLTRGQLIDRVWGSDYVGDTKTLDVHIKRIRSRIEQSPSEPSMLVTVRGLGYRFEA